MKVEAKKIRKVRNGRTRFAIIIGGENVVVNGMKLTIDAIDSEHAIKIYNQLYK